MRPLPILPLFISTETVSNTFLHTLPSPRSSPRRSASTPSGSAAPSSRPSPPSSRCGSPRPSTTSPARPSSTASASKRCVWSCGIVVGGAHQHQPRRRRSFARGLGCSRRHARRAVASGDSLNFRLTLARGSHQQPLVARRPPVLELVEADGAVLVGVEHEDSRLELVVVEGVLERPC